MTVDPDFETNIPSLTASYFADGWDPYSVHMNFVPLLDEWTKKLALIDSNFRYHQIKSKFGEARVYAEGNFGSLDNSNHIVTQMERALSDTI